MSTADLRLKYQDNIEVINKLKKMLETCDNESKKIVQSSIELVEKEQQLLVKNLRKRMYQNLTKKEKNIFKDKEPVLDENENIVYDITDVKITDAKEDTHLKVINITGEEDNKDNDITEVLKKEKDLEKELENAKVVFDGSYKLIYNNGISIFEQKTNEVLLDLSLDDPSVSHNFNITILLKNFDYENGTHINDLYMKDEIPVYYNFSKLEKNYDKKIAKKTKKMAKREKKYNNDNVRLYDNRFKKIKNKLAVAATLGVMAIGGIFGALSKNKIEEDTSIRNSVVSQAGETDASYEKIKLVGTPVIEEIPELDLEKEKVQPIKDTKTEQTTETKEESIKIGDTYSLDSVDLYTASTDVKPTGNTDHVGVNYSYKAKYVSVVHDNKVMNLVYNDSINLDELHSICEEKYGDNFEMFINFDVIDKDNNVVSKNVGWAKEDQVLSKGKVLKR